MKFSLLSVRPFIHTSAVVLLAALFQLPVVAVSEDGNQHPDSKQATESQTAADSKQSANSNSNSNQSAYAELSPEVKEALSSLSKKDLTGALSSLEKAFEKNPKDKTALKVRAEIYLIGKRYELALDDYKKLLEITPDDAILLVRMGECANGMNDRDGALAYIDRAISLSPNEPTFPLLKASIYGERGDFKHTIDAANEGLNKFPDNALLLFAEAYACETMNADALGALRGIARALQAHPDFIEGYEERAKIERGAIHLEAAKKDYDTVLEVAHAAITKHADDSVEAMKKTTLTTALTKGSNTRELVLAVPRVLKKRADLELEMHDLPHAVADINDAHSRVPNDPSTTYEAVRINFNAGDTPTAVNLVQELLRNQPDDQKNLYLAALIAMGNGDFKLASDRFQSLIKMDVTTTTAAYAKAYDRILTKYVSGLQKTFDDDQSLDLIGGALSSWPFQFSDYVNGKITEQNLLDAYKSPGSKTELHAMLGLVKMAENKNQEALKDFQWVVSNGSPTLLEYGLSKALLNKLKG